MDFRPSRVVSEDCQIVLMEFRQFFTHEFGVHYRRQCESDRWIGRIRRLHGKLVGGFGSTDPSYQSKFHAWQYESA